MIESGSFNVGRQPQREERVPNNDPLLNPLKFRLEGNNFYAHFVGPVGDIDSWGESRRQRAPFREAMRTSGEFQSIAQELLGRKDYLSDEYQNKLYRAYEIMHPFASSNYELFA